MKLLKPWGNSKLGLEYVGISKLMVNFCKGLRKIHNLIVLLGISGFCFADGAGENAGGAAVVAAPVRFLRFLPGSGLPLRTSAWKYYAKHLEQVGRKSWQGSLFENEEALHLSWLEVKNLIFSHSMDILWVYHGISSSHMVVVGDIPWDL